jgi:hypothetical protein
VDTASTVSGVVVDAEHSPLAGRTVAIGERRTTTDAHGCFEFGDVPPTYEVAIVEPNGAEVTVYQGITRRDPLLYHEGGIHEQPAARAHRGQISGRVSGGPVASDGNIVIEFSTAEVEAHVYLGGTPQSEGPSFGPLEVSWDGAPTITGQLVTLRTTLASSDGGLAPSVSHEFAQRTITLHDGEKAKVDLQTSVLPRIRGTARIELDPGTSLTTAGIVYVSTSARGVLPVGGLPTGRGASLDWDVPDLGSSYGLCFAIQDGNQGRWITDRRCGTREGPVALHMQAPPSLEAPPSGSQFQGATTFSWSPVSNAIYFLDLEPVRTATRYHPHIWLYTADTQAKWPDRQALGISFPTYAARYKVRPGARGPYRSMDEATGPQGIGAKLPTDSWGTEPAARKFDIESPGVGSLDPTCQFEYGTGVGCGAANTGSGHEYYMLAAINNVLHHYPEVAQKAGLTCVRDCASARLYIRAYGEFAKTHPGFDANAPTELMPPKPPVPTGPPKSYKPTL